MWKSWQESLALSGISCLVLLGLGFSVVSLAFSANSSSGEGMQESSASPPRFRGVLSGSTYVPMRDGVKIAVDYLLPRGLGKEEKVPAILVQTRYWRSMVFPVMEDEAYRFLVSHGYAVVIADVRGTGASFGVWRYPWSEEEIKDGAELVDWILRQPWSNGKVGTFGTSYVGSSAEFLLVNKHPAVKAAVIRYSLFDAYTDIVYPGGIRHDWFMKTWNRLNRALDSNDTGALLQMMAAVPFHLPGIPGVKPVGGFWRGRKSLREAVREHAENGDVYRESLLVRYRDDYSENWDGYIEEISPYFYQKAIEESGAAVYSYTGWWDGYYTKAAVNRFLTLKNCQKLIIGPWPHGGDQHINPWGKPKSADFDHNAELLRFFDYHLKGIDNGLLHEPRVRYYTLGEEVWHRADTWPPPAKTLTLYLRDQGKLSSKPPSEDAGFDAYRVDYSAGAGRNTRYESLLYLLLHRPIMYPDREERDKKLLVYETEPLERDLEITGHPVVRLWVSSDREYGHFFVYLEEVDPEGKVAYLTEGMLDGEFRKTNNSARLYQTPPGIPWHSFTRDDAEPLPPGKPVLIEFDLQPISVLVRKGRRIRVAIAGADKDHFALPPGPPPVYKFYRTRKLASSVILPVFER